MYQKLVTIASAITVLSLLLFLHYCLMLNHFSNIFHVPAFKNVTFLWEITKFQSQTFVSTSFTGRVPNLNHPPPPPCIQILDLWLESFVSRTFTRFVPQMHSVPCMAFVNSFIRILTDVSVPLIMDYTYRHEIQNSTPQKKMKLLFII